MLATNIPLYKAINQLPIIFDPKRLVKGGGVEEIFHRNKANYNQSSRLLFYNINFRESKTGKLALIAQQMGAAPRYEEPGVIASSVLCEKKNQSLNLKKL